MNTELTAPTKLGVDPITTALVAAGVPSSRIEALAKDYGELAARTQPIETPEEYEVIKRAQLACRDVRTDVTAALKLERDEAVKYQKFVLSEEKRILAEIAKTEDPLKKLREDYDKREELKAQEEARQWVEKMNLRKQAAFDVGYYFNGQAYLLDRENGEAPWVLREDQVAGLTMSDEALYALLEAQAAELKMTREIKAEAAAKAEEERQAAEAEQKRKDEEAAAKLAEIERREQEQKRKEAEMIERENQMALRILRARNTEVTAVGGVEYPDGAVGFGAYTKTQPEVVAMTDDEFTTFVAEVKNRRMTWDAEEKARKEKEEQERIAREEQLQKEAAARAVAEERERAQREREAEEKKKQLLEEQEREKALQASDREKVGYVTNSIEETIRILPEMKSSVGQHAMKTLAKQLSDIVKMLDNLSNEL